MKSTLTSICSHILFPFRLLCDEVWCAYDVSLRFLHYYYVGVIYIEGDTDSHVEVYRFLSFIFFTKALESFVFLLEKWFIFLGKKFIGSLKFIFYLWSSTALYLHVWHAPPIYWPFKPQYVYVVTLFSLARMMVVTIACLTCIKKSVYFLISWCHMQSH